MNLYDLTDNFNKVYNQIQSGEDSEVYLDTLNSIEDAIEEKAIGYAKVIKNIESDNQALAEEIKRLQGRKASNENAIKNLKSNLQDSMEQTGKTVFKTPLFSFGIQNNKESTNIIDETKIPEHYFNEQPKKLDKRRLLEDMQNGEEIEGADIKQTRSLRIR